MNLSGLVLVKNEEEVLEDCLKSLSFCNEIIVLDQKSTDKTVQIARKFTNKVLSTREESFSKNRNILLKKAKNDWVIYLDADERISQSLKNEIVNAINSNNCSVFYIPRENYILGHLVKHGGFYPDFVPRVFNRQDLEKWQGEVHESPIVKGKIGYLKHPIIHFTARSVAKMLNKSITWGKIEANLMHNAHVPKVSILRVVKASTFEFMNRYFAKLGLLDGVVGLIESIFQALHKAIVMTYLWEIQNRTKEMQKHK